MRRLKCLLSFYFKNNKGLEVDRFEIFSNLATLPQAGRQGYQVPVDRPEGKIQNLCICISVLFNV